MRYSCRRLMDPARTELELIRCFVGRHVLVVGDLFLDEYWVGQACRLSREAPVPVLESTRRFCLPGGAANPAHNIVALGGRATVVGLVGDDSAGTQLLAELHRLGIGTSGIVIDPGRPTTTKTRIMAETSLRFPQQLARIDLVERSPLTASVEQELVTAATKLADKADAVLVSDYQAGVATPAVAAGLLAVAKRKGTLCTVDAQGSYDKYASFDVVKTNRQEAEASLGRILENDCDYCQAGRELLGLLGAAAAMITRGAEGLSLISKTGGCQHLPAANRSEVFDVTGAGDTVIAVATLAWLAGASPWQAAHLANLAAGLVVRKLGNGTVSPEELAAALAVSPGVPSTQR